MLRLLLLRHAHSDSVPGIADLQRPLTERGCSEAERVAQYLVSEQLRPDLAIVSSATRTQETWGYIDRAFDSRVEKITEKRIYEASYKDIVHVIRHIETGSRTALVVGHNPGLLLTARHFYKEGNSAALSQLQLGFPPASLIVMSFPFNDWQEVAEGTGTLERFETPATIEHK